MAPEASPICSFLFLLLLLPRSTAALSKPKPPARCRYHTLRATPLSPDPIARADAAAGEASMLELDPHDASTASTVRLVLAHREAFAAPNATAPQLLAHRLARDAARAEAISVSVSVPAAAAARNVTRTRAGVGFAAPVVSGLALGSGEYFAQVGVGTPPTPALLVLDTGSDVVWLQCAPCRRCYAQSGRVFDPRRSRSYAAVRCGAPPCRRLDAGGAGGCDQRRGTCLYQVAYGDGSVTAGNLATETLTFARGARVPRVAVGCGHDNEGLFVAAAGLLGLGRGRLSLPTQTARRYGRRFSYCLVDRTSSSSSSLNRPSAAPRSSTLTFGAGAVPGRASSLSFTPLVSNPRMATFYYVRVVGFSVGGARVRGVGERDLRLDPATGRGGVILDSGTSVTRLARPVYAAVRDAFRAAAGGGLRLAPGGFSLFDTCYDLRGRRVVKVPTVSVQLAGGVEVALPPENYLIPVDTRGTFCLALAGTDGGVSIVGNIQQQGFRVVFDGDRQRVALVPKSC